MDEHTERSEKHRILVIEDHSLVADLLVQLIGSADDFDARSASSLADAMDRYADSFPFDLVLLDYNLPGSEGLEAFRIVSEAQRGHPVAVISGEPKANWVQSVVAAGAAGIVPKTMHSASLLNAVRFMISGERYMPVEIIPFINAPRVPQMEVLNENENHVLHLIGRGLQNKRIAADLGIPESSVKMHVKNIFRKLGARNRTHAVTLARQNGLIES